MKHALLALLLTTGATPVLAQTPGPTPGQIVSQQQINMNRFQAQLQAEQLDQLQRQNNVALQQPDPNAQALAVARRQQIQQQIDQNTALQQQMLSPQSNPSDVHARLQQNDTLIQSLRQQQVAPDPAQVR